MRLNALFGVGCGSVGLNLSCLVSVKSDKKDLLHNQNHLGRGIGGLQYFVGFYSIFTCFFKLIFLWK